MRAHADAVLGISTHRINVDMILPFLLLLTLPFFPNVYLILSDFVRKNDYILSKIFRLRTAFFLRLILF